MEDKELLKEICIKKLKKLGVLGDNLWKDRFLMEFKEVIGKGDIGYFLKIREECIADKVRYENEHNSIIPFLLGISHEFDISRKPGWDYGEYPDIDIDYIDGVREYLKEEYAKELFGAEYVCNICNYNTFGMKSALKDMARIFGLDHEEIEAITKPLKDKDADGNVMTWDQTLDVFDDLKAYCERNPEVADAARRIMNRNRSLGQHASGLIVSNVKIRDYVPLVRGKEGSPASAWIEGLHGSDLSTVGFIKFDFLGLDGNSKIATTCKMACQDKVHFVEPIQTLEKDKKAAKASELINNMIGDMTVCALPGLQDNGEPYPSWSNTNYLDDPKAIEMANSGDLRMVFQFDGSPGIRRLAKEGGVTGFDDLVAYTALYRPGPMKLKYHENYINRKSGKETYTVHPSLALGDANMSFTYGVLCYQEQIARMLNTVGKVPWADCEVIRKAISKKKIEKFLKYKEAFIEGGQETLGETKEYLEHLWEQIEAFAGYGFNLSHAVGYTYISSRMLWLKAHLPKRFFASMFTHTKASGPKDYNKLKEYKREAERNGVKMAGLNLNKSKRSFIVNPDDDTIYYGFEKIKGIGEEAAKKLEELQPFTDFEDLLKRFGTDAKTVQALIALGCFKEHDSIKLYKFYEHYKKFVKAESDRTKRHEVTRSKIEAEIMALKAECNMNPEEPEPIVLSEAVQKEIEDLKNALHNITMMYEGGEEVDPTIESLIEEKLEKLSKPKTKTLSRAAQLVKLQDKLDKCVAGKEKKDQFIVYPTLASFDPETINLKLNENQKNFIEILEDKGGEQAEIAYYGYVWQHPIEKVEGYGGHIFEEFLDSNDKDGQVECLVREVKQTKGPRATYYSVQIEDATGQKKKMTVWEDDMERFKEELKVGKVVRLWVDAPKLPYPTFTLHQYPGGKWRKPPRNQDFRAVALN